jgi:hypothetical protein
VLPKVEEGKYYLEDHTAQVPLNFSQASLLTDGFVTENSIVLVEGEAIDGVLHVHNMGEKNINLFLTLRTDSSDVH